MAETKRKNQWDSVDASGHDWNSGEDFDPAPKQTQQTAVPAAQTATPAAQVQTTPQTPTTAYPYATSQTGGYQSAASPVLSALQAQAAQSAQQSKLSHVGTSGQRSLLDQWLDTQTTRANAQIDRGVTQGVNELGRVQQDAQEQLQTQRNQIDLDERRGLDNRAAYDAARGVRGGIAGEQYNSIMNTAAQNRVTVNQNQIKLSTDIYRQIAELRANGEFQKADSALELAQQYLQQLFQLEQWAMQTNLSIDQFNAQVDQWAQNYNLQLAELGLSQYQWEQSFNYQKQRDTVADNQWQQSFDRSVLESDRAFSYQQGRDAVLDARDERNYNRSVYESDRAFEYQQGRDTVADNQWQQQFNRGVFESDRNYNFTREQYTAQQAAQRTQQLASSGWTKLDNGIVPSAEERAAMGGMSYEDAAFKASVSRARDELGITSAELGIESARAGIEATKASTEATKASTAATKAQTSMLTSGTGTASGGTGSFDERTSALFQDAKASGNPQSYITNNYKRYGLTSSSGLYSDYKNWLSGASGGMSYEDARKEADSGVWSDTVYDGLTRGGMTLSDIIRVYSDTDEETGNPRNVRFFDYMKRRVGSGSGMKSDNFQNLKTMITNVFNGKGSEEQKLATAQRYVNSAWNMMNFEQMVELIKLCENHNVDLNL